MRIRHEPTLERSDHAGVESNDRMAMLGDSVLNMVVLQEAMQKMPSSAQSDDKLSVFPP